MNTTTTITKEKLSLKSTHHEAGESPAGLSVCGTGGYEVPGIPKFDDPYKKRQWQLEHMAGAFRVFSRKGFTEGTAGHISVRDPVDPSTFWINP